jgi:RNA 2',3'-cyclic 3'-phosphodiesterase
VSRPLAARFAATAKPVSPARWHISLVGLGVAPTEATVDGLRGLAAAATMPAFRVGLDRAVSWKGRPGRRPLVICGGEATLGVELLQGQLHRALRACGLPLQLKPQFQPHLTLLWGDHDLAEQPIAPIRWTVREFVLLHSGDGRQSVLGRWALAS